MTNGAMHGLLPRLRTSWWRLGLLSRAEPRRPRRRGQPDAIVRIQALASERCGPNGFFCAVLRTDHRGTPLVGRGQSEVVHWGRDGVREPRERVPDRWLPPCWPCRAGRNFSGSTTSPPMCKLSTLSWRQGMLDSNWAVGFDPPQNHGDHHVRTAVHRRFQL